MQDSLYVSLSAQVALEKRLTTIADNVANANTVGFRSSQMKFEEVLAGPGTDATAFVKSGGTFLSAAKGGLQLTGNELDFAIKGEGWFAVQTPGGQVLTRDGRFTMSPEGQLLSVEGHPLVDPGGAPIQVDADGGPISVGADGFMRQNGQQVGAIGLFRFEPNDNFQRYGNSGFIANGPVEPVVDVSTAGVVQGFVEASNVNPMLEMSHLIAAQRAFEGAAAAIKQTEATFGEAVRTLGGR